MQPIPDRQYEYKANLPTLLLGVLLFGVAALFFSYKAQSNVRGLIINGIITLSPEGATIFWWVFAGLSVAFVLAGIAGAILAMIFTQRVVLTARCLDRSQVAAVVQRSRDSVFVNYWRVRLAISRQQVHHHTASRREGHDQQLDAHLESRVQ